MPNLNMKDDGSFHQEQPNIRVRSDHARGNTSYTFLIVIMVLIITAGGVFYLNNAGIVKLWGPKARKVAVIPPSPAPIDSAKLAAAAKAEKDSLAALSQKDSKKSSKHGKKEESKTVAKREVEKEKSRESSKPAPAPAASGEYAIQLGSFLNQEKADSYASMLQGNGIEAYVTKGETAKGTRFLVRVGKYASRNEAKDAAAKFSNAEPPPIIVKAQ